MIRTLACWLAIVAAASGQQFVFRTYQQPQGLRNLSVNAVATDRDGFLWIATENGVYQFLGSGFVRYGREQGIAELDIRAVVAEPNGTVWVGTSANIYRWDGQRFWPASKDPIPISQPWDIALEGAGHLLVVDRNRLYRLEVDANGRMHSFQPVIPEWMISANPELGQVSSVSVVQEPPYGTSIWIGCGKRLYSWFDRDPSGRAGLFFDQVTAWGPEKGLLADEWENVIMNRNGDLWAGGTHHIAELSRGGERFTDRSIPGTDPESALVHSPLIEDREGRILVPAEAGIARWESGKWRLFGRSNGLQRSNHVSGMALDPAGDLWVGGRGDGLHLWTGYEDWEGWSDAQGLPSAVVWVSDPERADRVFVGTETGPAWVDPRSGASGALTSGRSWAYGQVSAMGTERDGSLWAGTFSGGVLHIDPKTGRTERLAKLPAFIMTGFLDRGGSLYLSTKQGLYVRDAKSPRAAPQRVTALDSLLGEAARVEAGCAAPDGTLWFLAENRLVRFRGGAWSIPPIDGLPKLHGSLLAISCASDGSMWTTGDVDGTWRLTPDKGRLQAWQLLPPPDLRSLAPLAILVDRRGWVWLGTDVGLIVWNGHTWHQLTQESGLIWNDVSQGSLRSAPDGSIWVGTSGGLAHLMHPEHIFNSIALPVAITGIQRGSQIFPASLKLLTLRWSAQPLTFQMSSPAMRNRSELIFSYRMEGLQSDWVGGGDSVATFPAPAPGKYTFEVLAKNPSLSAYSEPIKVSVEILPPWWQGYWFYLFSGLGFLLCLVGAHRLYARHVLRKSRELEKLVKERTWELEASRAQLSIQATHDGLTGLLNRSAILGALDKEVERAKREGRRLIVAIADLDHFKRVNDTFGHLAGDAALCSFANSIRAAIRSYDYAGRLGGEEFLLVISEIPHEAAEQRLMLLHAAISNLPICTQGMEFDIACSVGATVFDPLRGTVALESLLAAADSGLYAAKSAGRNRVVLVSEDEKNSLAQTLNASSV